MADTGDRQWFENTDGKRRKRKKPASASGAPQRQGANNSAGNKGNKPAPKVAATKSGNAQARPKVTSNQQSQTSGSVNHSNKPVPKAAMSNVKPGSKPVAVNPNKQGNKKVKKNSGKNKKNIKNPDKKPLKETQEVKKEQPAEVTNFQAKAQKGAKKKSLLNSIGGILVIAVALVVLSFIVYHFYNYIAAKPEFAFINNGSIEHTIGARALIVRDEYVVNTSSVGDLVTQATEGSHVSVGQNIAMVVPEDMASTVENLRNTQNQISEVQQELIAEGNAAGAEAIYNNFNSTMGPIIDMIRRDAMTGNLSDMSSYSSSISVLVNQRESELSELDFDDERLRVLRNDEIGYEGILERSADRISAAVPGIISFKLDGQENNLSFDYLLTADPDEINNKINGSVGAITSDLYINEGEPVARIAKNEEQFIAVFLSNGDASSAFFEVGSQHTLNIGAEGISIDRCVVERTVTTGNGMLIVFSTTRYVESLLDLRTVDIEIVISETRGLRVTTNSLVNPDYDRSVASIYINKQGFAEEVSVIITDYDREFAIIEPIGDNTVPNTQTVIITNPSTVSPGDKVAN